MLNDLNGDNKKQLLQIDPQTFLIYVFRYWYLIIFGLLLGFIYAFYQVRYTPSTYQTSSRMLVKDEYSSWGQEYFLPGMELVSSRNRLVNEMGIIKSYPLMERIAKALEWKVNYYKVGNIKTTDTYPSRPFEVDYLSDQKPRGKVFIEFEGIDQFRIGTTEEELAESKLHSTKSEFKLNNWIFKIDPNQNLVEEGVFAFQINTLASLARYLQSSVSLNVENKESSIILVSHSSRTPSKSIDLLNTLMEEYIKWGLEKDNEIAAQTIEFVDQNLKNIADSLVVTEYRLERFQKENFQDRLFPADETANLERVAELEEQLNNRLIQKEYYKALLKALDEEEFGYFPSTAIFGFSDPNLSQMFKEYQEQIKEFNVIAEQLKDGSEQLEKKNKGLFNSRKRLKQFAQNGVVRLEDLIEDLRAKVLREEKKVLQIPEEQREYLNIKRENKLLGDLYTFLLNKRSEASIAKASNVPKAQILDYASEYRVGYVAPQPMKIYLIAIIVGLGAPLLMILILYLFNNKIIHQSDLKRITTMPILGSIVHKQKLENNIVVSSNLKSVIAESFRSIRTNLNFMVGGKEQIKILVTSSISGEGKTFTSINLAIIYAASNKRTVIVGADLRKPKIFQDFDLSNSVGLSNYLIKKNKLNEVIQKTHIENLDLISAGPVPPNPAELIESDRMQLLFAQLEKRYDTIIIDSPPIGLVTDALLLSQFSDASLYIVRHNYTKQQYLKNIEALHESGKVKNIGIVINAIKEKSALNAYGFGSSYGYGYGYGYYSEDKT